MSDTTRPEDGIQEGISHLSAAHRELTSLLEDLQSELSPTLGQWAENAKSTYVEAQRFWDASTAKQREIMQRMPGIVHSTADD